MSPQSGLFWGPADVCCANPADMVRPIMQSLGAKGTEHEIRSTFVMHLSSSLAATRFHSRTTAARTSVNGRSPPRGRNLRQLSAVNGNVRIRSRRHRRARQDVNGEIDVENDAHLGEVSTVNGLSYGENVARRTDRHDGQGSIELGSHYVVATYRPCPAR